MKSAIVLFATIGLLSLAVGTGHTAFQVCARGAAVTTH
jgi:hypothetical protein